MYGDDTWWSDFLNNVVELLSPLSAIVGFLCVIGLLFVLLSIWEMRRDIVDMLPSSKPSGKKVIPEEIDNKSSIMDINNLDSGIESDEQRRRLKWRIKVLGKIDWPAVNQKLMIIKINVVKILTFLSRLIFVSILNTLTIVLLFSFFLLIILSILTVLSFFMDFVTNNEDSFVSNSISWITGLLISTIGIVISYLGKLIGAVISFIGDTIGSAIDSIGGTIQSYSSNEYCQLSLIILILIIMLTSPTKEGLRNIKKLSNYVFQFMISMTIWAFNPIGVYKNKSMIDDEEE